MSSHRFHPDPARGDPEDAILFDDCPRCAEHAEDPRGLDRDHLRALVKAISEEEWFDLRRSRPTRAELDAAQVVYRALCLIEKLTYVDWRLIVGVGADA